MRSFGMVVGLAAGGLGVPAAVQAQEATPLADIVVTAGKRETVLLQTPLSITVLPGETLRAVNADSFADFAALVPGLSYTDSGPGQKRYALRGLQSAGEPQVALYYDEIPMSGLPGGSLDTGDSQADIKVWDVDRIEVLRGPQGTLYGNGSMGGAIRILSRRPVLDRREMSVQATVAATDGGDGSSRFSGMVNIPLIADRLAMRLTAYDRREGGWIDDRLRPDITLPQIAADNLNTEHTSGGRLSLGLQVTPVSTFTAIVYYQDMATGSSSDLYPAFALDGDPYVAKSYVRTPWRDRLIMANLISETNLPWAVLTVTGSYQHREAQRAQDTTRFLLSRYGCTEFTYGVSCIAPDQFPTVGPAHETVASWAGEARLASRGDSRLQWTIGLSAQDARTHRFGEVARTDTQGYAERDDAGLLLHRIFARRNDDGFKQAAVFGEAALSISDRLTATVGLRGFHSRRTDQQTIDQQFFAGAPTGEEPFQVFSENAVFKKFELSWSLGSEGLVYVQAAQGFRAGGPNFPGGFTVSAPPYKSDSVWDYEAGWKLRLEGARMSWSGAVFRIDWSDLQQLVPTTLFSYIANAGEARSEGFETALDWQPTPGLSLGFGATYNDARLVGSQPVQLDPILQLAAGDKLANVPDWTVVANLGYRRALASGWTASARLGADYQSGRADIVSARNPAYFRIDARTLIGAHLALDSADGWRIGIDADNLFNVYAPLSAKSLDSNFVKSVAAARPRTVSLTLAVSY